MYGMYFLFVVFCIATYKGGGIIITISLHTYMCYLQLSDWTVNTYIYTKHIHRSYN